MHGNATNRMRHRNRGGATYRLVRYADDFTISVHGTREHAEALWEDVTDILSTIGLRLAADKTRVVHIDEGFDFLGFHIQRHRQKGSNRRLIYTYPSKKALKNIRRKVKAVTKRITHQPVDGLLLRVGQMVRGWALYFRHGSSSRAYSNLQDYIWWRIWRWLTKKHPRTGKRWIIQKYYNGWWPEYNGVKLYQPATMTIKRYRYRGSRIPTPWDKPTTATTA